MKGQEVKGCELCRQDRYTNQWPPPERIAIMPQGDVYLHRCAQCGTFWVFDDSGGHMVEENKARDDFPDAFA